jgi:peptide/nickel transport system substrate-binding protein
MVIKETYETLVRYEGDSLDFKPDLATSWEMSPDGRVYTFHLRQGVKFYPSGDPFNAQAVKASLDYGFTGPVTSVYNFGGKNLVQYNRTEIMDDYTVRVYMNQPLAWFMRIMAYASVSAIQNPNFIAAHGGWPTSVTTIDSYLIDHQDTTAAYIVDEFKPGDHVTLKRNPTYWMGWNGTLANRPERVVIRVIQEPATRMLLLGRMDADMAFIDTQYLPELKNRIQSENLPLVIDESPGLTQVNIVFDQKNAPTNDVHIRKMLDYSFDYDSYIANVLHGFGNRLYSFVPQGTWGYQPNVPHYDFDLTKAKAELDLAAPENQAMVKNQIKVTYTPGYGVGKEGYLMWKTDLAKIGVNLVLDEISYPAYDTVVQRGGVPILDRKWSPDFPDPATYYVILGYDFYVAPAFGTTPQSIVDLLYKAALETNQDQRLQMYAQVEQWAYDTAPYVKVASLVGGDDYNVRGSWVKGYTHFPMYDHKPYFYELWKELPTTSATSSIVREGLLQIPSVNKTPRRLVFPFFSP